MTTPTHTLARTFADMLRASFTPDQWAAMRERNRTAAPDVCASHDFCDANMVMLAAFEEHGEKTCLDHDDGTPEHEAACVLWAEAWDWAKRWYLTAPPAGEMRSATLYSMTEGFTLWDRQPTARIFARPNRFALYSPGGNFLGAFMHPTAGERRAAELAGPDFREPPNNRHRIGMVS